MNNITVALAFAAVAAVAAPAVQSPFACNVSALSPAVRTRHFDVLGPELRHLRTGVRELPNGYAFAFSPDSKTLALLAEWTDEERLCCPFFDIAIRIGREGGAVWLELTGRPGTKQFLEADAADWIRKP